ATLAHARGAEGPEGVRIHAVRLPGLVAHEEVIFGSPGEGLTLRHDSYDRQSFVAGVAFALAKVTAAPGLVEGLGALLD
ncbi:MAG: dihydrodipicolinate reductase C-terminal domain-containing protein, partial [Acidimicrobiales bacterium]